MRYLTGVLAGLLLGLFIGVMLPAQAGKQVGEEGSYAREQGLDQQFSYVASGNGTGQVQYQGYSQPGKLTSSATWQIRRFSYDSSNRISAIQWANGSDEFDKVWDSRASYTYSN